jgi:hypothetical protein
MKKITTICLAILLLPTFSILNAQSIYSESIKQASFIRPETVTENFVLGYAGTFTGFDMKKTPGGVQLIWKVSDWDLLSHFDIQKSTNGKQFTTIGSLGANEKEEYRFIDREPVTAPVYFRIKSVGRDGTVFYSNVISAGNDLGNIMIAYPMPAQNDITVQHALVADKGTLSVLTQEGYIVMAVPLGVGTMQTTLDLSYLKSGVYLIRFDTGYGKTETTRIVKQ